MELYSIDHGLAPMEDKQADTACTLVLLTPDELEQGVSVPGLEHILCHTPNPRDARLCKAEPRRDCGMQHQSQDISTVSIC